MDLHLSQAGLDEAVKGMTMVVNGDAGTGTTAFRSDMIVAGKTGTAQASPFPIRRSDGNGGYLRDANGKYITDFLPPSTHDHPDPIHPWYRATDDEGKKLDHAWFIGFAPAEAPKYAISVMVEYGGGGGGAVAGPIASQILDALIEHGYLAPTGEKHSFPLMP
jgi:cell division protein FtsI/penicillin-binding protein 2